ncbi:MAG TPA: cytochrome c biogenesis protein ResB [Dehalococcoidia bacterium]|nr:cytochrome c biogenesis protein ResB [Dehalococcoidia bacterium]
MTAGNTASEGAPARGWTRTLGLINPLRAVWWLFTNVRFAILLLVLLASVSLIGVLVAQMPGNVRGDAQLEADWLAEKEGVYGILTEPMNTLGLFDIFHAGWFTLLLAVTVVSTGAYVVSRFPGVWAAITRPRKRVPDRYFDLTPHRVQVAEEIDSALLTGALRRSRYRVERWKEGEATFLFADRFQFAMLGTLLTHTAVIVFILAAVVSRVDAFSAELFLAEGASLPVFAESNANQMQVQLLDAYGEFAPDGQPLDYRTDIAIYSGGEEVHRCSSTVNTPCQFEGYRFYQVAYFGFGAQLAVREAASGNLVYRETLALAMRSPAPRVLVSDSAGQPLLDETVVLPDTLEVNGEPLDGAVVRLDDGRALTLLLPERASDDDELLVLDLAEGGDSLRLFPGETAKSAGLSITYQSLDQVPTGFVLDLPLPQDVGGGEGTVSLQLSNVVYGTDTTSEGTSVEAPASGQPELTITGLSPQAVTLEEGTSRAIGEYEYTFERQSEFSGIDVRRDRSDYLVWVGAAAIVVGLMITFWVPRRRLWAKITPAGSSLAGQAAGPSDYTSELRKLASQAGADLQEEPEEDD